MAEIAPASDLGSIKSTLAGLFGIKEAAAEDAPMVEQAPEAVAPSIPNPNPDKVYVNGRGQKIRIPGNISKEKSALILKKYSMNQFNKEQNTAVETLGPGMVKEQNIALAEEQLGGKLARTPGQSLKEFEDAGLRFDLARSNLVTEKLTKLKDSLPTADIRSFDYEGEQVIAIKQKGETEYTLLDSSDVTTFSDIAEVGGMAITPEILTSILAAVKTRGASLLLRAGSQAAGGFIGRSLDIGIESARGVNEDPINELLTEAPVSAGFGGVAEVGLAPFRKGIRGVTGSGAIELTPEELLAQQTAREAGFSLTPGQLHPFIQSLERQSAAFSKPVQSKLRGQLKQFRENLVKIQKDFGDVDTLGPEELIQLTQKIETEVFSLVANRAITLDKGGVALQEGRKAYVKFAKGIIKKRYDAAIEAGDGATFDLSNVQAKAREILEGVKARTIEKKEIIDPLTNETSIVTSEGETQLRKLNEEVTVKLDEILKLDPNVQAFEGSTAFEQVKELRTALFDLKNATILGKEDINNRFAGQLWSELSTVMDNPKGGSDEFVRLLRKANKGNAIFEQRLDVVDLKRIAMETKPVDLVGMVAKPNNGKVLRMLMRIMPDEKYTAFRDSWKTSLLAKPENIGKVLDNWRTDRVGLKALLSPDEEILFRKIGREMDKLKSGPAKKVIDEDVARGQVTTELINNSTSGSLTKLITAAGGKNSPEGKSLGAGLVKTILDEATVLVKGQEVIDPNKVIQLIKKHEQSGVLDAVLSDGQIKLLKDQQALASFIESSSDVGVSLQKAEAAANVGQAVLIPLVGGEAAKATLRGLLTISKNAIIGRLLMSKPGQLFFAGLGDLAKGKAQPDLTTLRALASWSAQFTSRLEHASTQEFPRKE